MLNKNAMKSTISVVLFLLCSLHISAQTNYTYTYDDLNRLIQVVYGNGVTITYAYDEVGNRTQKVIAGNTNQKPDMTPTNGLLSLGSIGAGGSLTVSWRNENIGTALASGYSTVIALSTDAVYQAGTDIILATEYTNSNVAGAMPTVTRPLSIPSNQAAGNYKILIVADPSNAVTELSEANNLLILDMTVTSCSGISVGINPTAATCNTANGSATATGAGGTGFTYKWNTGAIGATLSNVSAGTYTVTATTSNGCQATQSTTVTNNSPPSVSNFTFTISGLMATFNNTSANATGYIWNFGDNTTSTLVNPTKTYTSAGSYNVCLTGINATCGNTVYCLPLSISGNGCDMVSGFSASNVTEMGMTVSWSGVAVATSYTFRYRQANEVNSPSAWIEIPYLTSPTYNLTGLSKANTYEFQVKTYCSGGATDWCQSFYWSTVNPYTGTSTYPYKSFFKKFNYSSPINSIVYSTIFADGSVIAGATATNGKFVYFKIDPTSTIIWQKEIPLPGSLKNLDKTTDGGFAIAVDQSPVLTAIKFDTDGNYLWSKSFDDPQGGETFPKVHATSDGGIILSGCEDSYYTAIKEAGFLVRMNASGTVLWKKTYRSNWSSRRFKDCIQMPDGGFITVGFKRYESPDPSRFIAVIMKVDQNGVMQWVKHYDNLWNAKDLDASTISLANNGDILVSGFVTYEPTNPIDGPRNPRTYLMRLTNTGNVIFADSYFNNTGSPEGDFYQTSNGDIIATINGNVFRFRDANLVVRYQKKLNVGTGFSYNYTQYSSDPNTYVVGAHGSQIAIAKTDEFGTQFVSCIDNNFYAWDGNTVALTTADGSYEYAPVNFNSLEESSVALSSTSISLTKEDICPQCIISAGIIPSKTNPCQNEAVTFSSYGSGLYYTWTIDGVVVSNQRNFVYSFAQAGSHEVHLLVYNNESCFAETSYIYNTNLDRINVQAAPSYTVATVNETCDKDNGAATVTLTSQAVGATVVWSNGKTGVSQNGLSAGTYQVLVTGSNGCSAIAQNFTISNTGGNMTISEVMTPITCNGANNASISLSTLNSIAPYTYTWSNGATSTPLSNLAAGSYTVTVADGLGCTQTKSFVITEPSKLRVQLNVTDITNCGSTNGTITSSNLGGTPPYSYQWNNGQTTQTAISLVQNNYILTVTDSKGCTARNVGTVGMQNRIGEIFYSNSTLSGISNVVLHRGQFAVMIAKEPADHFAGYPDTLAQFFKLDLVNETGTIYNLETSAAAASIVHGNLTNTPDGKLSMVYQAPIGSGYGFRGMHRIYDNGNSLTLDEQVFSNANWGAWMRHVEEANRTRVVSFANGGYYVLHHKKENGGAWQTVSLGSSGNYLGGIQLAKKSDNSLWFSGRYGTAAIGSLRYYTSLDGSSYGYGEFPTTTISPSSNCDIEFTNSEQLSLLANQNDTLRLMTNTSGSNWTIENIVYQPAIEHRASLFYRTNGNTVLAYQTPDKLVVMEKTSSVWSVKYAHNNLIQSDQIGGSRAPSLLIKGSDLWVVYADGQNVYKYNLDLPCEYVQLYAKVLLQGAYNSSTGLMSDNLRSSNLIPTNEPYTGLGFTNIGGGNEAILSGVINNTTGNNAIVDWVFLELRDGKAATTKIATRCALVQRDGDIVDIDGISPITFKNVTSNTEYYVVLKHRNHLGVMTALPTLLIRNKNPAKIDFTDPSVSTWGTNAQKNVSGKMCLWAGDINQDHYIKYNGANNDKNVILSSVGLTTPNNIINAYHKADINLDGLVKYNGASNDKNTILANVGLITPNNILTEQIPNQ